MARRLLVKVTRNRQVTIPARVSRELGIKEGDVLEVRVEGDAIVMRKVRNLESLAGSWRDAPVEEFVRSVEERWRRWSSSA